MANKVIFPLLLIVIGLAGCTDDVLPALPDISEPQETGTEYWYSRTRTPQEEAAMSRHHALGFSYQALTGKKCNLADVTCQVLNLEYLKEADLYLQSDQREEIDQSYVTRGVVDYLHQTTWNTNFSADLLLYSGEIDKTGLAIEKINERTLIFEQVIGMRTGVKSLNLDLLLDSGDGTPGELTENPDMVLSDNFRYALSKLRGSGADNVAVVDSFINIFGTHVVTSVATGGTFDLTVRTENRNVQSYYQETEYKENCAKFFVKWETIESSAHQSIYRNIFQTAEVDLRVKGGDPNIFNSLVADPSYDNVNASYANYSSWLSTVRESSNEKWDDASELIDMEVRPIWEFIPDAEIAQRVKVRIVASAAELRNLYGDTNFVDAIIKLPVPTAHTYDIHYNITPLEAIGLPRSILHVVEDGSGHPLRIVAASYYEWIPALGGEFLWVTYPVYENRIVLTEGIGRSYWRKRYYKVKWLYDRFEIQDLGKSFPGDVYLSQGRFITEWPEGFAPLQTRYMPDYEWPGSTNADGTLNLNGQADVVIKCCDKFFFARHGDYPNLPGYTYVSEFPAHIVRMFSGIEGWTATEIEGMVRFTYDLDELGNMMMRNEEYVYHLFPNQLRKR